MENEDSNDTSQQTVEIDSLHLLLFYMPHQYWHILAVVLGIFLTPLYAYLTLKWTPSQMSLPKEEWTRDGTSFVIIATCLIKTMIFFVYTIMILREIRRKDSSYFKFLDRVLLVITISIVSFAIDYYFCYWFNPNYFTGVSDNRERMYFDFFYYSFMTLTTVGYGNIVAIGRLPMCVVMLEVLLSIAIFIGIVGGFDKMFSSPEKPEEKRKKTETTADSLKKGSKLFRQPPPPRTWRKS